MHVVVRFCVAKNLRQVNCVQYTAKIQRVKVLFKSGRTNIHNEERYSMALVISDELVLKINEKILESQRFTISQHSEQLPQSYQTVVTEELD